MDRQTPINANGTDEPSARDVARSAANLWHHILVLGELQMRMLAVELVEGIRQARFACVVLFIGFAAALASLPVALACLALVLAETMAVSLAVAFAITSVAAVSLSCVLVAVGWRQLRKNATGIPRSREELKVNWRWLKDTSQGQHASRRRPQKPVNGRV
jgi:hypothetical protein